MPCVAEVVNRSLKADCTDFTIFSYVTGFRCSCGACTEANWLKSRSCDLLRTWHENCWMNQCSRVELSGIVKIKIILITFLIHIYLKILGIFGRHQAHFALMQVKVIINPIMQRCKVGTVRDNGLITHTR